jgi:hypothetical protein
VLLNRLCAAGPDGNSMTTEIKQRRAISILVLLGSILFMVVTWNYSAPDSEQWKRPSER